jgi:7-carboxy-7-deazaguanine synthase
MSTEIAETLLISEIFTSLQGETSLTGIPFTFVRLTGCNLRCHYCDSAYAFHGGKKISIQEIIQTVTQLNVRQVLITGGEPLLQARSILLAEQLIERGIDVSFETHGAVSLEKIFKSPLYSKMRIIMDIKTPGSGENNQASIENLKYLKRTDEIKFVLCSAEDYEWAKDWVLHKDLPTKEILFSPVIESAGAPGPQHLHYSSWTPKQCADLIVKDRLPVRFQLQLHKLLWGNDTQGV